MEEISNTLNQIYSSNMDFLQNKYNSLYKQIRLFEKQNKENWYIDFVDGRFELCDESGLTIYNCDPFYDSSYRAKNIHTNPKFMLTKTDRYERGFTKYDDCVNAYEFVNQQIDEILPEQIDISNIHSKFIFIGTLLGVHLNDIHREINSISYLIVEPNIEIFRLSLFLCDYTEFANSELFFCVGDDDISRVTKAFLENNFEENHFIKFELASEHEGYLIEKLNIEMLNFNQMSFPFSEYLMHQKRGLKYFVDDKIQLLKVAKNHKILSDLPVLFLGAGPSLPKSLEWIYMNQDRFVVVCASAVLKRLELLKIVPDIIVVVDGQKNVVMRQFEVANCMYEDSICLIASCVDSDVVSLIRNKNTFLIPSSLEIFQDVGELTGVTVSDISIKLLLKLGVQNLFVLGVDAALRDDGKTHDGLHASSKKININQSKNFYDSVNYNNHLFFVDGNLKPQVPTTMLYKNLIECVNETIQSFPKTKVYNLSKFGAKFEGAICINLEKFDFDKFSVIFDKAQLKDKIFCQLDSICKKELSCLDKQLFLMEIEFAQKIKQLISKSAFDYVGIKNIVQENQQFVFAQILLSYFKLISPYCSLSKNYMPMKIQLSQICEQYLDSYFFMFNSSIS